MDTPPNGRSITVIGSLHWGRPSVDGEFGEVMVITSNKLWWRFSPSICLVHIQRDEIVCLTGNGEKLSSTQAELASISCATSYLVTQYLSFEEDMFASSIPPVSCHHRAFAFLRILEKTGMAIIPLPTLAPRAPQPRLPITESVVASMCRADETITITHAHVPLASLLNMNDNLTKVPPKQQLGNSNV